MGPTLVGYSLYIRLGLKLEALNYCRKKFYITGMRIEKVFLEIKILKICKRFFLRIKVWVHIGNDADTNMNLVPAIRTLALPEVSILWGLQGPVL